MRSSSQEKSPKRKGEEFALTCGQLSLSLVLYGRLRMRTRGLSQKERAPHNHQTIMGPFFYEKSEAEKALQESPEENESNHAR
jgi:hypothetical protein